MEMHVAKYPELPSLESSCLCDFPWYIARKPSIGTVDKLLNVLFHVVDHSCGLFYTSQSA